MDTFKITIEKRERIWRQAKNAASLKTETTFKHVTFVLIGNPLVLELARLFFTQKAISETLEKCYERLKQLPQRLPKRFNESEEQLIKDATHAAVQSLFQSSSEMRFLAEQFGTLDAPILLEYLGQFNSVPHSSVHITVDNM